MWITCISSGTGLQHFKDEKGKQIPINRKLKFCHILLGITSAWHDGYIFRIPELGGWVWFHWSYITITGSCKERREREREEKTHRTQNKSKKKNDWGLDIKNGRKQVDTITCKQSYLWKTLLLWISVVKVRGWSSVVESLHVWSYRTARKQSMWLK